MRATCPVYLIPLDLLTLFDPNVLFSALYSYTFSVWFSLNVRHQVSHPYKNNSLSAYSC